MSPDVVAGVWVNVVHECRAERGLHDPARIQARHEDALELRFPGEDFNRLYVHEDGNVFVLVREDGSESRATLSLQRKSGKPRAEMESDLEWAGVDLSALDDRELLNIHAWYERQIATVGSCCKPVSSVIRKERRRGATNRLGDRFVVYTRFGIDEGSEMEHLAHFRRRDAVAAARKNEAWRWARETDPFCGRLVNPMPGLEQRQEQDKP